MAEDLLDVEEATPLQPSTCGSKGNRSEARGRGSGSAGAKSPRHGSRSPTHTSSPTHPSRWPPEAKSPKATSPEPADPLERFRRKKTGEADDIDPGERKVLHSLSAVEGDGEDKRQDDSFRLARSHDMDV